MSTKKQSGSIAMARTVYTLVTPAMAQKWLGHNTGNRPINHSQVCRFADQMKNGEWRITTDSIGFDLTGKLINGQHRLAAVVESGTPVTMAITYDLPQESMSVIDQGTKRSVADSLGLSKDLVAISNFFMLILYGRSTIYSLVKTKEFCNELYPVWSHLKNQVGDPDRSYSSNKGNLIFAAAIFAFLDARARSSQEDMEFVGYRLRCWFTNSDPSPLTIILLNYLKNLKYSRNSGEIILKALHLFDRKSQGLTKLHEKNPRWVRTRIRELFQFIPPTVEAGGPRVGKFDPLTGQRLQPKAKRKAKAEVLA